MSSDDRLAETPRRSGGERYLPYVLIAGAVALGWQIAVQPLKVRAPVEMAVRLTPNSAAVLARAAESELAAGRDSNAGFLARESLYRTPFSVRALRVIGLSEARTDKVAHADELITLAGNWSLRDDPSHAWLIERRLQQGNYGSAFAHADTLARRRVDVQPQIFRLFTIAASSEPRRALPVIAQLMSSNPPWRNPYWQSLPGSHEGLAVAINLAVLLERSDNPVDRTELELLYQALTNNGQIDAVGVLRSRLGRPVDVPVTNPGFEDPDAPAPFQWALAQQAGATAMTTTEAAGEHNHALRVEYDGYTSVELARQRTFLKPGRYRLRANAKVESGEPVGRMTWTVRCAAPGGDTVASVPAVNRTAEGAEWSTSSGDFTIPGNCPSQFLDLQGEPLDRRTPMVAWFDDVTVTPLRNGGS